MFGDVEDLDTVQVVRTCLSGLLEPGDHHDSLSGAKVLDGVADFPFHHEPGFWTSFVWSGVARRVGNRRFDKTNGCEVAFHSWIVSKTDPFRTDNVTDVKMTGRKVRIVAGLYVFALVAIGVYAVSLPCHCG